ncbi:MAG TPA: endonuclease domain-containing protein [Bacteroidia bacterium]|jgi:very-short-patch-repair endonuclease|nr:endonuclease domain-containing protein [Bacteroidia bacterium]
MKPIESPFYYGASPEILKRAEILRKQMTMAEKILWEQLNKNQVKGYRFRAQHPIGKFIVDFYCHEATLVIELDGKIHENKIVSERDDGREEEIKKLGIRMLRFTNDDVFKNIHGVLFEISAFLNSVT